MRVGSLFSGIGGMDLGLERAGMEIAWQVEIDDYCRQVLAKHWPDVPRYGDIKELRGDELEPVDLLVGGPPCQPVSVAGKRQGAGDDRWLWGEALRIVGHIRPRWCLFENPSGIISMGLDDILSALEAWGYACRTVTIPACSVGAPHRRDRVWVVADRDGKRTSRQQACWARGHGRRPNDCGETGGGETRPPESSVGRVLDGLPSALDCCWPAGPGDEQHDWEPPRLARGIPNRTKRLKALGNAVVPAVVEVIGRAIMAADEGGTPR